MTFKKVYFSISEEDALIQLTEHQHHQFGFDPRLYFHDFEKKSFCC